MEQHVLQYLSIYKNYVLLGSGSMGAYFIENKFKLLQKLLKSKLVQTITKTILNYLKNGKIWRLGYRINIYIDSVHIRSIIKNLEITSLEEEAIPKCKELLKKTKREVYPEHYFDILTLKGHCHHAIANILEFSDINRANKEYKLAKTDYLAAMRLIVNTPKIKGKQRRKKYVDSLLYCNRADGKLKKTSQKLIHN